MPRSPSGVYSAPPGTTAVSGQTISSAAYNSLKDDLVQDANTPRPVVAGGTGANNEEAARENLGVYGRSLRVDTSGITVGPSDDNQVIDFTGTGTLITDPAGDLGDGWRCYVFASGGDVTINPNVDETVNGAATCIVPQGASGVLSVYDGNFRFEFYGGQKIAFIANKNDVDQSVSGGVNLQKVTFTNEVRDEGGFYDTANSRWTPPAGVHVINAQVGWLIGTGNRTIRAVVYKNGSPYRYSPGSYSDRDDVIVYDGISVMVEANGTDYFEIYIATTDVLSSDIDGDVLRVWFSGHAL